MDVVVELRDVCPVMLRYHLVPEGSPVSMKLTEYVTRLNVTASLTEPPFTVKEPELGEGLSILYPVAMT